MGRRGPERRFLRPRRRGASAAPTASPAAFYAAKVSEITNQGYGESAKVLSALYTIAKEDPPAVIFLDEFEALAARRGTKMADGAEERRTLSTLLAELDGLADKGSDAPYVLTMAATNCPWDLDRAVLSRFGKRIFVPLPDAATRRGILELQLSKRGYQLDVDWDKVLQRTDGFSGRELELLAQEVVNLVLEQQNPELTSLAVERPETLGIQTLRIRPIRTEDLLALAEAMEPQTSPEEENRYTRWTAFSLANS